MRKNTNWAILVMVLLGIVLVLSACGGAPAQKTPTVYVDEGATYVVGKCGKAVATEADLAYVAVTVSPSVIVETNEEMQTRSYISWASPTNPYNTTIGPKKWVYVICAKNTTDNADIVKGMAEHEKAIRPDWSVWYDGVEVAFEDAVNLKAISEDGKINEWTGANSEIMTVQPGMLSYWVYSSQQWQHIKFIKASDDKIALVLPLGWHFENDPMYVEAGHLIVTDGNGLTYFWVEILDDGTTVIKVPERRLYWRLDLSN